MALLHSTHFRYPVLFLIFSFSATCTFLVQMGLIITASSESAADIIFTQHKTNLNNRCYPFPQRFCHSSKTKKQRNVWSLPIDHDLVLWATFHYFFNLTLCAMQLNIGMTISDQLVLCIFFTPLFSIVSAHLEPLPRWYKNKTKQKNKKNHRYYSQLQPWKIKWRMSQAIPWIGNIINLLKKK